MLTLELPRTLWRTLAAGHPWIYRDHVPRGFRAASGSWVEVRADRWRGYALWDAESAIALRVFSESRVPDAAWLSARVRDAWQAREPLRSANTTAYRWLFGEGDGVPGITVDLYGGFAVLVTYAESLEVLVPWVVQALGETAKLDGVVRRRKGEELELLQGRLPPRDLVVTEHAVRLGANLYEGQKTGLFLDHRDNRQRVRELCAGKRVLNLFSYTGAFSVYAALGGARQVVSVDAAPAAVDATRRNLELNGLDAGAHELVVGDVFEWLERANSEARRFDLVVCDPPSFAKSRAQLEQALSAYTRLNTAGLRVTERGGLYAAGSCTAQVSPEAFRQTLAESARRAKRRLRVLHEAGHPLDHPVMAGHPEGRYLKLVLGQALALP